MTNPKEAAFPLTGEATDEDLSNRQTGLTKREYFAAKAMQGMVTTLTEIRNDIEIDGIIRHKPNDVAEISVVYADALIAALKKIR